MVSDNSDWCSRLVAAVADGRFLEDPNQWKPHLAQCHECTCIVEGLFYLEDLFAKASLEAPVVEYTTADAHRVMRRVRERYAFRQRAKRVGMAGLAVLVIAAIGSFLTLRMAPTPADDPATYAEALWDRVFPADAPPRYALLRENAGARDEYLQALDSPSSLVRRTALWALLSSGVPLSTERLSSILQGWDEQLEAPITVAGSQDPGLRIAEALESRRSATLAAVLRGLVVQVAHSAATVPHGSVTPFLTHADPEVRKAALRALAADPAYAAEDSVGRLLETEVDAEVRKAAADCLLQRGGAAGAGRLVGYLRTRTDRALEQYVSGRLADSPVGAEFLTERAASANAPLDLALAHAISLLKVGRRTLPEDVISRVLADPAPELVINLALYAQRSERSDLREPLQEVWRKIASPAKRLGLAGVLMYWDLADGGQARLSMAMEIAERDRSSRLDEPVRMLTKCGVPAIEKRARALMGAGGSPHD